MEARRLGVVHRRQRWLFAVLLLFAAWLAWLFIDIQIRSHDHYVAAAQRQQEKRVTLEPTRGVLYDRNGVALAVNTEEYEVYLVPNHIQDVDRFVDRFVGLFPYDEAVLREKIAAGGWYVRLRRGVSRETIREIKDARIRGVGIETYSVRHYPYGDLAADLLGRVDTDQLGIEGIELFYDDALRGTPGSAVHQRDALGREYPNFAYPLEPPVDGHDIHLTIDVSLQEIVGSALDTAMDRTHARGGSMIVIDPRSGEVLAMSNRARVDGEVVRRSLRNFAVVDQFEPGSTFKLVPLTGLYEEGLAAPTDSLFCEEGTWRHNGRVLTDVHPYGYLTVEQVIEASSNICAAKLAAELGDDRLYRYARRFGFGLPTGLDFPGEPRGLLKRPDTWSALTPASIAMGYEVMVTSLQMAMAYASVANGGELLRPYLVRKIIAKDGRTEYEGQPQKVRRVMSAETARLVTQALVKVVETGTGRIAQFGVLAVAGKTGTSRKVGDSGGYERGRYNSTFAGFFPAHDPRYVVFIRIDEPVGAFYGGTVAAPVFHEAMERRLLTESIAHAPGLIENLRSPDRVIWKVSDGFADLPADALDSLSDLSGPDSAAALWQPVTAPIGQGAADELVPYVIDLRPESAPVSRRPVSRRSTVKVPDLTGLALRSAVAAATELGLRLSFNGAGRVAGQVPEPGEIVAYGARVRVENP